MGRKQSAWGQNTDGIWLMDMHRPGMVGSEAARRIKNRGLEVKVVAITFYPQ